MKRTMLPVICVLALLTSLAAVQSKAGASGPEQALKDIENKWAAGYLKGDAAAIAEFLADDFISVSTEGKVMSKADVLAEAKKSKITRSAVSDMRVRVLDADAAIISGAWSGAGTDPSGKKFDTSSRWTDVFTKKDGKWKCVSSHSTTIAK